LSVYGVRAMAIKEGKAKNQAEREETDKTTSPAVGRPLKESEIKRPGLEKYVTPGPWTEEDERFFQIMAREFGEGHGGRDSDL
jgi:hypothetical protein